MFKKLGLILAALLFSGLLAVSGHSPVHAASGSCTGGYTYTQRQSNLGMTSTELLTAELMEKVYNNGASRCYQYHTQVTVCPRGANMIGGSYAADVNGYSNTYRPIFHDSTSDCIVFSSYDTPVTHSAVQGRGWDLNPIGAQEVDTPYWS